MDQRAFEVLAGRLRVDSWMVEVVVALEAQGIRPIVLKGPAIARWLYADDPAGRPYGDVDLIVDPLNGTAAVSIIESLGYHRVGDELLAADEAHSRAYERPSDHAGLDLHTRFHGMDDVTPERAWRVMSEAAERMSVGGIEFWVPAVHVRAMNLALHISPSDEGGSKAAYDLCLGLEQLDRRTWSRAADLARDLGIDDEFGHRLSRVTGGAELAIGLGLPTERTRRYAEATLADAGASPDGLGSLLRLGGIEGRRARADYIFRKLFPSREVLQERDALAGRRTIPLAAARLRWVAVCVGRLPRAIGALRRLRA